IHDHEREGLLTFREVMEKSSNIGVVKAARPLGVKGLYAFARWFGFGQPTGIDLPGEGSGLLRPPEQWSGVSMYSIPYGQEISVTPVQLLQGVCMVANGGHRVRPHVIAGFRGASGEFRDPSEFEKSEHPRSWRGWMPFLKTAAAPAEAPSVQVSSQTCGRVNDILEDVVQKGTGMGAGIGGYRVAGKTGTAEKAAPGSRGYARNKYVA